MLNFFTEKCRVFGVFFLPCLLFGCLPQVEDMWMMTSFVLSQVMYYTLQNVSGMLFLATLVLILWTKNIMKRWYRKQMLTGEFFGKLLYMGLTAFLSLLGVVFLWVPLYDAYACAVSRLDGGTTRVALQWRDQIFAVAAFALAASTVASSDLVLRPNRVDDSGIPWLLHKAVGRVIRLGHSCLRVAGDAFKTSCRSMRDVNTRLARVASCLPVPGTLELTRRQQVTGTGPGAGDSGGTLSATSAQFLRPRNPRTTRRAQCEASATSQTSEETLQPESSLDELESPQPGTSRSTESIIQSTSKMLKRCIYPGSSTAAAVAAARLSLSRWSSNSFGSGATRSCASADSGMSVDEASTSSTKGRSGSTSTTTTATTRGRHVPLARRCKTVVLEPSVYAPMTRSRTRMLRPETRSVSASRGNSGKQK